jgi:hypothetical protein
MAGISDPGLIALGFWIQRRRLSWVFSAAPAAIVARLIKCVRSGPKRPFAGVPATAWQFMQALLSNTRRPASAPSSSTAGFCWERTQAAKSAGPSTETRRSIFACCVPQYCAHWPRKIPVRCGSIHILLGWFGMRSVLPANSGTQKLWSVSAESNCRNVGVG